MRHEEDTIEPPQDCLPACLSIPHRLLVAVALKQAESDLKVSFSHLPDTDRGASETADHAHRRAGPCLASKPGPSSLTSLELTPSFSRRILS